MSNITTKHYRRRRPLRKPSTFQIDQHVEPSDNLNLDEWDKSDKFGKGKLISRPIYSRLPEAPIPSGLATDGASPKESGGPGPISYGISKWNDPDPEQPVVDVKNDSEFLRGLSSAAILRTPPFHPSRLASDPLSPPNSLEEPLQRQPKSHQTKSRKPNSTLEEVMLEMCAGRKETSSNNIQIGNDTEENPLSSSQRHEDDMIKLCSFECDERFMFSRQMIALSGKFCQTMDEDGFDGVITIAEGKEAMRLLGAWMSRDLNFEINISNCRCLLRLASTYDIPGLKKDVLPHLINLPLHPFDAYNYGKLYSIPVLSRLNADHVMENFRDYVDTHFKELVVASPDDSVELVKRYLHLHAVPSRRVDPALNRFRKWLAEEAP